MRGRTTRRGGRKTKPRRAQGAVVVIGVTGGPGTGKSTVAKMFKALGAVVLDADVMAREVMQPKQLAYRRVIEAFGEGILNDDETIDRKALAGRIFTDAQARTRLEAIVHPQVLRLMKRRLHVVGRRRGVRSVVLDVPLLIEAGAQELIDALVVVTVNPALQRQRLQRKFGWSEEEIDGRIGAQLEQSAKVAMADHVVDNTESVDATRTQVRAIWNRLVEHRK